MGLKKGHTNNPNGRPQGAKNKGISRFWVRAKMLFEDNLEQIQTDLNTLEPKERLAFLGKLLAHACPGITSVDPEEETEIRKALAEEKMKEIATKALIDKDEETIKKIERTVSVKGWAEQFSGPSGLAAMIQNKELVK